MAAITLPEELKPALTATLSLSHEAFEQFLSQLQSAPMSFSDSELADNLTTSTRLIPPDTVSSIVEMLVTFQWIPSSAGVSTDEFLNDLVEAINESDIKTSIELQPEEIRLRLAGLLGAKSIAFAASARQLRRNYERTFCSAELFTDIRPMFGNGDDNSALAAIVVHTLKISYHERNLLRDFFVALTSDDLDILEELIENAREQSEHLDSVLDSANLAHPKPLSE
jgi:hypothetical protein